MSTRCSNVRGSARGVLSLDSDSRAAKEFLVGVGVIGDELCQLPENCLARLGVYGIGTVSSSAVRIGTTLFHVNIPDPGEGGCAFGVYLRTKSVHRLKIGSGMWSFQLIFSRYVRSFALISATRKPDILLQALAE